MEGILLVSKKSYSLSCKKAVTEWKSRRYDIKSVKFPNDFNLRSVEAELSGKTLLQAFPNLDLSWSDYNDARSAAGELVPYGRTDVIWYVDSMCTAFVIDSHKNSSRIINATSIDALKKEFA